MMVLGDSFYAANVCLAAACGAYGHCYNYWCDRGAETLVWLGLTHFFFGPFPLTSKIRRWGYPYSSLDNVEGRPIDLSANPLSLNFNEMGLSIQRVCLRWKIMVLGDSFYAANVFSSMRAAHMATAIIDAMTIFVGQKHLSESVSLIFLSFLYNFGQH